MVAAWAVDFGPDLVESADYSSVPQLGPESVEILVLKSIFLKELLDLPSKAKGEPIPDALWLLDDDIGFRLKIFVLVRACLVGLEVFLHFD